MPQSASQTAKTTRSLLITSKIILLIGLGMMLTSGGIALHTRSFLRRAAHASGNIIGIRSHRDPDSGGITYRPEFMFQTPAPQTYRIVSSRGTSSLRQFTIGQKVSVLYDPANPTNAKIEDFDQLWHTSLMIGGGGFLVLLVGAIFFTVGTMCARRTAPSTNN